jgi:hypothetical protein
MQRAIRHPAVEQPSLLDEFEKNGSLPSGVTVALPLHMDAPRKGVGQPNARPTFVLPCVSCPYFMISAACQTAAGRQLPDLGS